MVDDAWRQRVQFKVAHAVRTDDHRCILLIECFYHLLQCLWRGVEVVAVQLDGKSSAAVVIDGDIPAAADAQVCALRDDMHEPLVVEAFQQFGGLVGRVVVHHDHIELETGFLSQSAVHGITDGLLAVEDRNDD